MVLNRIERIVRDLLVGTLDYQDIRDAKDRVVCAFEDYAQIQINFNFDIFCERDTQNEDYTVYELKNIQGWN